MRSNGEPCCQPREGSRCTTTRPNASRSCKFRFRFPQPRGYSLRKGHQEQPMAAEPIVRVANVHKYFRRGSEQIDVLMDLSLEVPAGEFLALMGPSGSGKTTLLNLIAGLDQPGQGTIQVGDEVISAMSEARLARWRTRNVGFIFQFYNLLPVLTAYENVELPLLLLPMSRAERKRQVTTALDLV